MPTSGCKPGSPTTLCRANPLLIETCAGGIRPPHPALALLASCSTAGQQRLLTLGAKARTHADRHQAVTQTDCR